MSSILKKIIFTTFTIVLLSQSLLAYKSNPTDVKLLISQKETELKKIESGEKNVNGYAIYGLECPENRLTGDPNIDQFIDGKARALVLREEIKILKTLLNQLNTNSDNLVDNYLGCFRDQGSRDLNGYSYNSTNMTPQECIATCTSKNFKYAGVQYSNYCFCGNSYGKYGVADNCNMACSGDQNQICGGSWANSVYLIASKDYFKTSPYMEDWFKNWKITQIPTYPNGELGKIMNTNEKYGWKKPIRDLGDAMPPEGGQGAALYLHPKSQTEPTVLQGDYRVDSPDKVLLFRVAGNRNGDWNMVVKINGEKILEKNIDGKKWHEISIPLKNYSGQDITVDLLISASGWYYEYAFIDEIKMVSKISFPQLSVQPSYSYIGCYKDKGDPLGLQGRDLNGYIYQSDDMTIQMCSNICNQKGFKYAGVQYSKFCFCGNSYGKYGVADNCNMACSGDQNQICGGSWANSVYSLYLPQSNQSSDSNSIEYGIDRPGSDYKNFDLSEENPIVCKQACDNDEKCKAWTYVKPGYQGPYPKCWLKSNIPNATKNLFTVSGIKNNHSNNQINNFEITNCKVYQNTEDFLSGNTLTYLNPYIKKINLTCSVSSIPANTEIVAQWYYIKSDGEKIFIANYPYKITQNNYSGYITFYIEMPPEKDWPNGKYEIVLTYNGAPIDKISFLIQ